MREPRYPVTQVQEGLAGLEMLAGGTAIGTTAELVCSPVPLSAEIVDRALQQCLAEQPPMRVRLVDCEGLPYLETMQSARTEVREVTVASSSEVDAVIAAARTEPLDPFDGEMTRAVLIHAPDGDRLLHLAHHLVLDGMGAAIYLRRFGAVYSALAVGSRPTPIGERMDVAAMARADGEMRRSARHREARERWRRWREELPEVIGAPERTGALGIPDRVAAEVPAEVATALPSLAARIGVAVPDLVVAVLAGLAPAPPDADAVSVGVPVAGRIGPGRVAWAAVPSTAMTVLPTRVPEGAVTLAAACTEVARWRQRATAGAITQEHLLAWDRADGHRRMPAVQLNVLPFDPSIRLVGRRAEVRNVCAGPTPQWTLTVRGAWGGRSDVHLELDHNPAVVPRQQAEALLERAVDRLRVVAASTPETAMSALPRCSTAELAWLRAHESAPHELRPRTLYEAFARGTAEAADRVVVGGWSPTPPSSRPSLDDDRHAGAPEIVLRGADVWNRSRALAAGLAARGVHRGSVVAVALPRSPHQVLVAHALLHLGAVYLPVHVDLPAARREGMCAQAEAVLVVTEDLAATLFEELRNGEHPPLEEPTPAGLDDPAYILFTSGSTGRPKGVVVTHRAIDNRLQWMQHHCALRAGEPVLYKTPCSFDVHIWELYWPLQVGAHLCVAPEGAERDPEHLAALLVDHDIAVVHFVPGMLEPLVSTPSVVQTLERGCSLRVLVCSGEALGRGLAERAHAVTGCWPLNLYGPTEAAIDVTVWDSGDDSDGPDVPLGRPVWNTTCTVRDETLRRVPPGEVGTLYLGGPQLAAGYLGRPDLTAAAFRTTDDGQRLYDTGDLALWDADGRLRYRGRRTGDRQVKIRGQRIELGEVEQVIAEHPAVREVICTVAGHGGGTGIVAHVLAGVDTDREQVRQEAEKHLAPAMRPVAWALYDTFPTTANGKVDRNALRDPRPLSADRSQAPQDLESGDVASAIVSRCFAAVLDVPVGPEESFFAAGGDSLACVRLLAELDAELGWAPRVTEFMAAPTPVEVAAAYRERHSDGGPENPDTAGVWLRRPGDAAGAPLVLLPPAGGLCWPYLPLVAHLQRDRPVLAVVAPQVVGQAPDVADLDDLAAWQLRQIRKQITAGRFHIAGWSTGGSNAQHLASCFPDDVLSVTLLDAYPAETWQKRPEPGEQERLAALLRMGGVDERTVHEPLRDPRQVQRTLEARNSPLATLGEEVLDACTESIGMNETLTRAHRTAPYAGPVLHIGAEDSRRDDLDATQWRDSTPDLRCQEIPGSHVDLVRRANAADVATAVEAHLERAEAPATTMSAR